jgi:hypothetical protein
LEEGQDQQRGSGKGIYGGRRKGEGAHKKEGRRGIWHCTARARQHMALIWREKSHKTVSACGMIVELAV